MRLWSIQTAAAWAALQADGALRARRDLADPGMLRAYQWMAGQMRARVGPPPRGCALPIWAWHQWESQARPRPDLRCGGHLPRGSPGVLLELEVSPGAALLSDFDLWHAVLNGFAIPDSLAGDAGGEMVPDAAWAGAGEPSWLRIFDLDWSAPGIAEPRRAKQIQATLWQIERGQVLSARPFRAR